MVEQLIDEFEPDEILVLAEAIRTGEISEGRATEIREAVESTTDEEFRQALRTAPDTAAYTRAFNALLETLDLTPIRLDVATVREFLTNRDPEQIERLGDEITAGNAREGQVETLRDLLGETRPERIRELVEETDAPLDYAAAVNVLLDALGEDRIAPPEPGPPSAEDFEEEPDVEIEERTEEQIEAAEEIRRLSQNYNTEQLRELEAALRQNNLSRAPDALSRQLIERLDRDQQERLAAELRSRLPDEEREGDAMDFIEEAEPGRTSGERRGGEADTGTGFDDAYPLISEVVAPGSGRDEAYFRRVKNVITGARDARDWASGRDVPTDGFAEEVADLNAEPSVRQDVIDLLDQRIAGGRTGGAGGGGAAGGAGAGAAAAVGGDPTGAPGAAGDEAELQDIAARVETRFDVTQRPPPTTSSETLRQRFPTPQKRIAYVNFESGRLGQVDPPTVREWLQLQEEEMDQQNLNPIEWLTSQQLRFIDRG